MYLEGTRESGHVRLGESYCMELHSSSEVAIGEKVPML